MRRGLDAGHVGGIEPTRGERSAVRRVCLPRHTFFARRVPGASRVSIWIGRWSTKDGSPSRTSRACEPTRRRSALGRQESPLYTDRSRKRAGHGQSKTHRGSRRAELTRPASGWLTEHCALQATLRLPTSLRCEALDALCGSVLGEARPSLCNTYFTRRDRCRSPHC